MNYCHTVYCAPFWLRRHCISAIITKDRRMRFSFFVIATNRNIPTTLVSEIQSDN